MLVLGNPSEELILALYDSVLPSIYLHYVFSSLFYERQRLQNGDWTERLLQFRYDLLFA